MVCGQDQLRSGFALYERGAQKWAFGCLEGYRQFCFRLTLPLEVSGAIDHAEFDWRVRRFKVGNAPRTDLDGGPQSRMTALRLQECAAQAVGRERGAFDPSGQQKMPRRPLIDQPDQMLESPKVSGHTFARS